MSGGRVLGRVRRGGKSSAWLGLVLGYKGMGVSGGSETDDKPIREYDFTYYGPIFGLNLHWGHR